MSPQEIKDLRKEKKMTQEVFGGILGITKSAVSQLETGKNTPSRAVMKRLKEFKSGDIVMTELTDLEVKLLDQIVKIGHFRNREDYLTESLKYFLTHGEYIPLDPKKRRDKSFKQKAFDKLKEDTLKKNRDTDEEKKTARKNI